MESKTAICNVALARIGEQIIAALTDANDRARYCNVLYDSTRQAVLRDHEWNSATKRVRLAQLVDAPAFEYDYQYQLPADFICVSRTEYLDEDFRIEGRVLLTDSDELNLVYIYDLQDVMTMDVLLRQAIAARLAWELVQKLKSNETLRQLLWAEYRAIVDDAIFKDANESPALRLVANEWTNARNSGGELPNVTA